jgi:hypothetical protein
MPSSAMRTVFGLHLELPHLAADGDDLRDAGDGHQRGRSTQSAYSRTCIGEILLVDGNRDLHDLAHDRADRPHARHHALGSPSSIDDSRSDTICRARKISVLQSKVT